MRQKCNGYRNYMHISEGIEFAFDPPSFPILRRKFASYRERRHRFDTRAAATHLAAQTCTEHGSNGNTEIGDSFARPVSLYAPHESARAALLLGNFPR